MIYTVTCNPAVDYVVGLDRLEPGQLNRAGSELIQFGGKGVNVSNMLRNLGMDSVATGFVAGFTGAALEQSLMDAGMEVDFVHLKEGFTRINVKLRGGQETEINGRGPAVSGEEWEAFLRKLDRLGRGDVLVLAGSLPPGLPQTACRDLLAPLADRGVDTVVDTAGEPLRLALPLAPFLVKPNRAELEELLGRRLPGLEDLMEGARELRALGARNVLLSLGGEGALLLDETGAFHRMEAPVGRVVNSVGAGDAMVAGFLAGWMCTGDYGQAFRLAVASGSATAFSDGLADWETVERLLHQL